MRDNNFQNEIYKIHNMFEWYEANRLIKSEQEIAKKISIKNRKRVTTEYYNIPCSFDIETYSFYRLEAGEPRKCAIMYIWQFCYNGLCFYGRTWDEFLNFLEILRQKLKISPEKRLVIYVHNLQYEFQFIRKWFEWLGVFTIKRRKVAKALTTQGFEFRCSYLLSGSGLENVGKNMLLKYKIKKMVGDLDYTLARNSKTRLTMTERRYCENDVRVVTAYIQERIESDGDITKIPMTQTGYVRRLMRKEMIQKKTDECYKNKKLLAKLTVHNEDYDMLKEAFQGGFTHANAYAVGKVYENVESLDETSAYPFVMLTERYPMSAPTPQLITENVIDSYASKYCLLMKVRYENIVTKETYENYLSESKCRNVKNAIENNGRIVEADSLETTITDVDYYIIKQMYDYEKITFIRCFKYEKKYLPKTAIETILTLYENKTKLKGVIGEEEEYQRSKGNLNSSYGMMIMDIQRPVTEYDNEWLDEVVPPLDKVLSEYNKSKQRFNYYAWGVWITAYARRNLFMAINECKNDYKYSDTDSVKITNFENHRKFFENYKENVIKKIKNVCFVYDLDFERFEPVDIKGKKHLIGEWTDEGTYSKFKTLGAKRYMYIQDDKLHITVAGLSKKKGAEYLAKQKYPFSFFNHEMKIPAKYAGRNIVSFIDEEIEGELKDYQGNIAHYHEKSYIHMEESEYNLSLSDNFIKYLNGYVYCAII